MFLSVTALYQFYVMDSIFDCVPCNMSLFGTFSHLHWFVVYCYILINNILFVYICIVIYSFPKDTDLAILGKSIIKWPQLKGVRK